MKTNSKTKKTNDTAVRALEMLKLLTSAPQTKDDIVKYWFENNLAEDFNTDNLYKYFNTFKLFGINIQKTDGRYYIQQNFINTPLTETEETGLIFLIEYAKCIFDEPEFKIVKNITDKLSQNINDIELKTQKIKTKYAKILNASYDKEKYSFYRNLCRQNQRISIKYYNRQLNEIQQISLDPKHAIITPTGVILRCYNQNAETQDIYTEDIKELKQLPVKSREVNIKNSVTFKITGRLALTYDLKPGEKIIESGEEYKVVTNCEEDKDSLTKRLLRYGTSCEIIYPKTMRQKTAKCLEKIKAIYE